MKCPVCSNVSLVMSERQGIEIDYCPECRGVWLDRGELDKIIERSITQNSAVTTHNRDVQLQKPAAGHQYHETPDYSTYSQQSRSSHGHQKPYKKKSLLSEIFDFD